ncbi:hypothetical protein [Stenotrophomonas sp. S39]|uniref:hypothetical protein n=1 Tax=Stenotrophomonas sp. S39 TaxID=2767451 RepID=UPI00190A1A44|nr:hypothetical protein [Stenotrophomonas sp. S39]MBK0053085.1 hypothetical protein [Stenotrophomonas sp. S39]
MQLWTLEDHAVWLSGQLRRGFELELVQARGQVEALLESITLLIGVVDEMGLEGHKVELDQASAGAREALIDLKDSLVNYEQTSQACAASVRNV